MSAPGCPECISAFRVLEDTLHVEHTCGNLLANIVSQYVQSKSEICFVLQESSLLMPNAYALYYSVASSLLVAIFGMSALNCRCRDVLLAM